MAGFRVHKHLQLVEIQPLYHVRLISYNSRICAIRAKASFPQLSPPS